MTIEFLWEVRSQERLTICEGIPLYAAVKYQQILANKLQLKVPGPEESGGDFSSMAMKVESFYEERDLSECLLRISMNLVTPVIKMNEKNPKLCGKFSVSEPKTASYLGYGNVGQEIV